MALFEDFDTFANGRPAVGVSMQVVARAAEAGMRAWNESTPGSEAFILSSSIALNPQIEPFMLEPTGGENLRLVSPRVRVCFHVPNDTAAIYRRALLEYDAIETTAELDARDSRRLRLAVKGRSRPRVSYPDGEPAPAVVGQHYASVDEYKIEEAAVLITLYPWLPQAIADLVVLPHLTETFTGISIPPPYKIIFIRDTRGTYLCLTSDGATIVRPESCPYADAARELVIAGEIEIPEQLMEPGFAHGRVEGSLDADRMTDDLPGPQNVVAGDSRRLLEVSASAEALAAADAEETGARVEIPVEVRDNLQNVPPLPENIGDNIPHVLLAFPNSSLSEYIRRNLSLSKRYYDTGSYILVTWGYDLTARAELVDLNFNLLGNVFVVDMEGNISGHVFAVIVVGCVVIPVVAIIVGGVDPLKVDVYPHVDLSTKRIYLHAGVRDIGSNLLFLAAVPWPLTLVLSIVLTAIARGVVMDAAARAINELRFEVADLEKIGIPTNDIRRVVAQRTTSGVVYGFLS